MNILVIGGCGYIGSAVYWDLIAHGHVVTVVDTEVRGNPGHVPHIATDYAQLSTNSLRRFDTVIMLAGHSSVASAMNDPGGAFTNNVVHFHQLLERLRSQRFIYASSSSVYAGFGAVAANEETAAGNLYDLTKLIDDGLASLSGLDYYGLRFGTVNGPSPNTRYDVMLNRMVKSAREDGCIKVTNGDVSRPILGIRDLIEVVRVLVESDSSHPGLYNLASFNARVADMAHQTAALLGVHLVTLPDVPTYDFFIQTDKFEDTYNFEFCDTLESIVAELVEV